jgi:hypothetical protein
MSNATVRPQNFTGAASTTVWAKHPDASLAVIHGSFATRVLACLQG